MYIKRHNAKRVSAPKSPSHAGVRACRRFTFGDGSDCMLPIKVIQTTVAFLTRNLSVCEEWLHKAQAQTGLL